MKKSLLALAVLGAFAGGAVAQSSVTMYGLIDVNVGKDIGSAVKRMAQGASSRLGFRGVEDLGGGLAAFFQLENRYTPVNGRINGGNTSNGSATTFWQARSYAGLRGGWGDLRAGREYDGAFFHSEVVFDPWGWDTVVSSLTVAANAGGISIFNVNRSITYASPNFGGFSFSGQIAESNENCVNTALAAPAAGTLENRLPGTCAERPKSFGATFASGPLRIGVGHNNPGNLNDVWTSFGGTYDLKVVKLWGQAGNGKNTANQKVSSYQLSVSAPVGQTDLRAAIINRKNKTTGVTDIQGIGLGAHYALSPRTVLYVDYASNSKAATEKGAYDAGLKHTF